IENHLQFPPSDIIGGREYGPRGSLLVTAGLGGIRLSLERHTICDAMQPARDRIEFANRGQFPSEQEKCGLASGFYILIVLQDEPTNAVNHWPMAAQENLKGGLLMTCEKVLHQLSIGLANERLCTHGSSEPTEEIIGACPAHSRP